MLWPVCFAQCFLGSGWPDGPFTFTLSISHVPVPRHGNPNHLPILHPALPDRLHAVPNVCSTPLATFKDFPPSYSRPPREPICMLPNYNTSCFHTQDLLIPLVLIGIAPPFWRHLHDLVFSAYPASLHRFHRIQLQHPPSLGVSYIVISPPSWVIVSLLHFVCFSSQ
jgi:hypothetical protein